MFLKNDKIIIRVGGLVFYSHFDNNLSHFRLDPTAIQGWTDGVDVRRDTSVRPTSWGDFSETGRLSSRLITISGTAIAQDHFELQRMRDAFMKICVDGDYSEMSLETGTSVRYATVTLGGKPNWVQIIDKAAAWKIDLYAPDPRIYGAEERLPMKATDDTTGGLDYQLSYPLDFNNASDPLAYGAATNNGNVECWPKIIVTGDYPQGFSVSNNRGGLVTYTGQVTLSSPVTIDMGKGSVTQGGVDKSILLSRRDWWSILPGETVEPAFIPVQVGVGWCDILFRDTWI